MPLSTPAPSSSGGGLFSAYAILSDVKGSSVEGGTFTSGAWRTRDLNTEVDPSSIVTLSSNQFTLAAGTYLIRAKVPALQVDWHKAKLYNITDSTDDIIGTSEVSASANLYATSSSHIIGRITIAGTKTFEIQHRCTTTRANYGFGSTDNYSVSSIYTVVEIWKES